MRAHFVTDVLDLARSGQVLEGDIAVADMARLRDQLREAIGAIHFSLRGRMDPRGRPAATLALSGSLTLTCDRCGQAAQVPVDHLAAFYFVRDEAELGAVPVSTEDEPEPLLASARFDVAELVEDETILSVPLSPRHDKCPDDAAGAAPAARAAGRNPFAALPDLVRKKGH